MLYSNTDPYTDPSHDERRALRADLLDELNELPTDTPQSAEAGERALEIALGEWEQTVLEPKGEVKKHPILIRYIQEGAGWSWIKKYRNRKFAWCGCFSAWCWRDSVSLEVRKKRFPSTFRMRQWAKGTPREIIGLESAQCGDIAIVGSKKAYGDHITMIQSIEAEGAWTVEGNAWGETPLAGPRKEGVIRRFRSREEIRFIYRPLESDR